MKNNFLISARKQFEYYKMLGDKTFEVLTEKDIHWQFNNQSNSVAIIVNHITGNMLSRWTDFLTSDGEKEWRNRDREFEEIIRSKDELLNRWEEGWTCLFKALDSINENNFDQIVYIRNIGHTIVEAVNRQLAHYAYHIGQVVTLSKMLKGEAWESLSIPKGASKTYNQKKFQQQRKRGHFTDEFLKDKP